MIKDIREKLIKRLKRTYRVCFDIADVRKIVDELPESEFVPNLVYRDINADEDNLFDRNVTDVNDGAKSILETVGDCQIHYRNQVLMVNKVDGEEKHRNILCSNMGRHLCR